MTGTTPRILIIAGSDSGGGAGIQADIKTVTMLGGHAMTAITALTVQNTLGVTGVMPVPPGFVVEQMDACICDIGVDAVKIGMIGSPETVHAVAERLEQLAVPIVFDPVMVATSGSVLADPATIAAFHRLAAIATVVTPNAPELAALTGRPADTPAALEAAARSYAQSSGAAVLAKGGHLGGGAVTDLLVRTDAETARWSSPRIDTFHTHGTGCTLASGVATGLAGGMAMEAAIAHARHFVRLALLDAPALGRGHGPMGHHKVRLDLPAGGPTLNQVTVPASDYQASLRFYQLLGCRQIVDAPPRYARFEAPGGFTLSIEAKAPPAPPSEAELFFQCADVDGEVRRLEAAGIVFTVQPEDRSYLWRVAETRDPHGNRICLYSTDIVRRFPPWRLAD
jgi:hydroxymethylpyrimidine/phosphomethylpyrimidine kinase